MTEPSLWASTPRKAVVIFLAAVFFVFASFGFVSDVFELGQQSPIRFAASVVLTGLFAIGYAFSGISLRSKFLWAILPLFIVQFAVMNLLALWQPNVQPQRQAQDRQAATQNAALHDRMSFDGTGIILSVSLGYTGFIFVFISEGRRYLRAQKEKVALEAEMAAAREIQELILPGANDAFPGFRVESVYRPASQVGGDFFQVLSPGKGSLLVVIGDVAGKGLPAAMLVSMLVGSIRSVAEESHDPVHMLNKLQDRLMGQTRGGFCTGLAAHIDSDGSVRIANAGHVNPYLDGREIALPGALPLGIVEGTRYEATTFRLESGSRLTFYSDGVIEATSDRGELLGFDRAQDLSRSAAAEIMEAAVQFGQSDDITVLTVERLAA